KGEKYLREFAEEMWRQCGMRVAVLTAWKDGSGQTMTTQRVTGTKTRNLMAWEWLTSE
ncbi:hypothetical protein PAXRUDRAFT_181453, partial [Paxillus rubicundulus Ve08.2h10]